MSADWKQSQQEYWNDIIRQADVASLLMAAETALNQAARAALDATRAKTSPNPDSATDTRLMIRFRALQRQLHEFRMSAGPVEVRRG